MEAGWSAGIFRGRAEPVRIYNLWLSEVQVTTHELCQVKRLPRATAGTVRRKSVHQACGG